MAQMATIKTALIICCFVFRQEYGHTIILQELLFVFCFSFMLWLKTSHITHLQFVCVLMRHPSYGVCNLSFIVLGRRENRLNFELGTYTFRWCHRDDYVFIALNFFLI